MSKTVLSSRLGNVIVLLVMFSLYILPGTALATPPLELPWACEESYRVTQGHNTGTHTGRGGWAWDFNIPEGGLLVAPADGVIRAIRNDSTRYGCDSRYAWDANYVIVDFGDGTEASFLHTRAGSSRVGLGESVRAGEPLAEVGLSGYVCGAHLHFQIQQTCNSWWCQSVPATFLDVGDPVRGTTLESQNCQSPAVCLVSARESRVIDERDECYRRDPGGWWEAQGGHGDRYDFTFTTPHEDDRRAGSWHFEVAQDGFYEVEVHLPDDAQSRRANYYIHTAGTIYGPVEVDQSAHSGWVSLGRHFILNNTVSFVELASTTGEPQGRKLVFDAIRVTRKGRFHP